MNKKPSSTTDGFTIPRRRSDAPQAARMGVDSIQAPPAPKSAKEAKKHLAANGHHSHKDVEGRGVNFSKQDLDASLAEIDNESKPKKQRWWTPTKKKVKRFFIILVILLVAILGYLGVRALMASSKIFEGNVFDLFGSGQPLKMDENGRSNIVIFGTSEDSGAHDDAGANLTDSIMIASVDQEKKVAMLTSVPRDMWVEYEEPCISGFEGKINAVYQCGSDDGQNEEEGARMLMDSVGEVYGLDMHYYVHINNSAVRDAVDAVGGVEVVIESDDPRGVYDPNFDWECNYECNFVKHPNGPAHLNGQEALLLSRARDSTGMGYGLAGGNFAREQYQQKIIVALRDKAASAGTLANPAAVGKLIDSLGNNVRTNFNTREVRTLVDIAQELPQESITNVRLDEEEDPQVTTGDYAGQSIVQPILGLYDYSGIHAYINSFLSNNPSVSEDATIDVLNGSGVAGAAQVEADAIGAEGLTVGLIDNAPEGTYGRISIYQLNTEMTGTKEQLETLYSTQARTTIPAGIESTADFVVVVGSVE